MNIHSIKSKLLLATIIILTANILLFSLSNSFVLKHNIQNNDEIVCAIYDDIREDNKKVNIQKIEESLTKFTRLSQLQNLMLGESSSSDELILRGMFLSIEKSAEISHLIILNKDKDIIFTEKSKNAREFKSSDFKNEIMDIIRKETEETWEYVGTFYEIDKNLVFLTVTAIFDDWDALLGYLVAVKPANLIAKSFAEKLECEIIFVDRQGQVAGCSTDEICSNLTDKFLYNSTHFQSQLLFSNNKVFTCHHIDLLDPKGNEIGYFLVTRDFTNAYEQEKHINLIKRFLISGITVIGLVFIYIMVGWLMKPLHKTVHILKDIAEGEGDLTMRIAINSKDEFGELSYWFDLFIEKLQQIIISLKTNVDTVNNFSKELSKTSKEFATKTSNINKRTKKVTAAVDDTSQLMNNISAAAEQMSSNFKEVTNSISNINRNIDNISEECKKESEIAKQATDQSELTQKTMHKLGGTAQEINKIVEVIEDIANKINLLALNATIESAKAGDAGKGFAVVANEIKTLAHQTQKATNDIEVQIRNMQKAVESSAKSISGIDHIITDIYSISSSISDTVGKQNTIISEIYSNVKETSEASNSITKDVSKSAHNVSQADENLVDISNNLNSADHDIIEIDQSSSKMHELANQLNMIVNQFKT